MSDQEVKMYLREDVYFEPLFNQWYAWPYLIPPVTAARYLVNTHRRIMKSFVNNYQLHILANKESALTGSEFLDCTEDQVQDIKALVDNLEREHSDLIALSEAVKQLDEMLAAHTSGESIEQYYEKVPAPLKGYVELHMDMFHNSSYRLLESLLYKSEYYKTSLQKVSFGMLEKVTERPFVLSTPRLPDENHIHMNIEFKSSVLDELFAARQKPITQTRINELLKGVSTEGGLGYRELFTVNAPQKTHKPVLEGVRVSYIGHAGFLVETKDWAVIIDPVIASVDENNVEQVISYSELPAKIDYVLITHNHQDHANIETLLQLRHKIEKLVVPKNNGGSIADPSMKQLFSNLGFSVIEVDDLEQLPVEGGKILSIPFLGEHGDINIRSKTAWYIEVCGKKMFFGADSSNLDPNMYRHIQRFIGDVDFLAIGMECIGAPYTWLYGALYSTPVKREVRESRRLNGADFDQAFEMVKIFNPKEVYLYALGMEPWYKYFMGLEYDEDSEQIKQSGMMLEACQQKNLIAERLFGKKVLEYKE
jgi:L-ascorbate metabolism protein UlaG (beta-lactamase superfamily)